MKIQSHLDEIQKEAEDYEAMSLAVTCFFFVKVIARRGPWKGKMGRARYIGKGTKNT